MTLDDLKRLFTRQTLFRLDAILSPRLVPILYALGLAGILLWAVSHLFWSFGFGFGNGLWGLLEIAVFGLLSLVGLRIASEALLVWFKAHEQSGETVNRSRYSASLLDEVRVLHAPRTTRAWRDVSSHSWAVGSALRCGGAPCASRRTPWPGCAAARAGPAAHRAPVRWPG